MVAMWLVVCIAIIIFLAGCVVILILSRKRLTSPFPTCESADSLRLDLVRNLPASPITNVTCFDALHSQALVLRADEYVREGLTRAFSGDGVNIAVQSFTLSSDELTFVYNFSENATSLYHSGQATIPLHRETGRLLPWMMDTHGSVIEQAKGVSMLGARLASAWALVVSSAHIISGLDIAKRLDKVDRKVSELLAGRKIDQDSRLIRIYTEAASILNGSITLNTLRDLTRLRYELFELRQTWRGEIHHLLKTAGLPDKSGWHPSSWYRRGNRETKSLQKVSEIAEKVRNLRVALITGAYIAQASGTTHDFVVNEVPGERPFWNEVSGDMQKVLATFRREKTKAQLSSVSAALGGYTAVLDGTTGCSSAEQTLREASSLVGL